MARGLAAVHEAGVVHRDVKPENILLDRAAVPYATRLADFGIARMTKGQVPAGTVLLGTPDYIAPELVAGAVPTSACDLYALGIVLYELCCGVTPFAGGAVGTVLARHAEVNPPRPAGVPDALWGVIAALTAKDPAARPSSARGVATELAGLAVSLAPCPAAPRAGAVARAGLALPVLPAFPVQKTAPPPVAPPPGAAPPGRGRSIVAGLLALLLPVLGFAFVRSLDAGSAPDDVISATGPDLLGGPVAVLPGVLPDALAPAPEVTVEPSFDPRSSAIPPGAADLPSDPAWEGDAAPGAEGTTAPVDVLPADPSPPVVPVAPPPLWRVTLASGSAAGAPGSGDVAPGSLSADGRFLAFSSSAPDLVPGDTNVASDVFVKDTTTGLLTRVSTAADAVQGDAGSDGPVVSADGRRVAFFSRAANLVPGDTNGGIDVFVKDLSTGAVTRASTAAGGAQVADFAAASPRFLALSADGGRVAFFSDGSSLLPDDTNGGSDVFVKDLATGATVRASTAADGAQAGPCSRGDRGGLRVALSGDGGTVVFGSGAADLVGGDVNNADDVFVKNLDTGAIVRASTAADGTEANKPSGDHGLAVSRDGATIAFESAASNLVPGDTNAVGDVFVKDLSSGRVVRASTTSAGVEVPGASGSPSLSADGRTVAFDSAAPLAPDDGNTARDVYVRDVETGETVRASLAGDGAEGDGSSSAPALAADGRSLAFLSVASTLVPGDENGAADVFLGTRA